MIYLYVIAHIIIICYVLRKFSFEFLCYLLPPYLLQSRNWCATSYYATITIISSVVVLLSISISMISISVYIMRIIIAMIGYRLAASISINIGWCLLPILLDTSAIAIGYYRQ